MRQRFVDYFELGGLDPDSPREKNYKRLVEEHRKGSTRRSDRGRTDQLLLTEAMAVFGDPVKYREYRAAWEQRQHRDETEIPSPPPADDQPPSTEPAKGNLWSVLGSAALKAVSTYVENKQRTAADPAQQLPRQGDSSRSSLTGLWRDALGVAIYIEQRGNRIALQQRDAFGNVVFAGEGVVARRTIQFVGGNAMGHVAQGVLQVERNGQVINGHLTWSQFNVPFQIRPVVLRRS
jgi:hypothetical protein